MASRNEFITADRAVESIQVGVRHRKDLGDLTSLMDSIAEQGLLQPITVTEDGWLICGRRRLEAVRQLGWRTIHVWTRCDLSDNLSLLLAERDDNLCHKDFNKIELADLYEEYKALLTPDAAARQEASRFGGENDSREPNGDANFASPAQGRFDTRRQAASMVGGASHTTLEKVAVIREIAADTTRPDAIREQAVEAVKAIEAGEPVQPWYRQVRASSRLNDLERIAADQAEPQNVRDEAITQVILMRDMVEADMGDDDMEKVARTALDRIKAARRKHEPPTPASPVTPKPKKWRTTIDFCYTWDLMGKAIEDFNQDSLAAELTDEQWQTFQTSLGRWSQFSETVAGLRQTA